MAELKAPDEDAPIAEAEVRARVAYWLDRCTSPWEARTVALMAAEYAYIPETPRKAHLELLAARWIADNLLTHSHAAE